MVTGEGAVRSRVQRPTDISSPEATLRGIAETVDEALAASGVGRADLSGVGLGIPGKVDPIRGVGILSVNLAWHDVPVTSALESALGLACFIENDVKAAALGESRYGAGRGLRNLIYLALGTGIAAGILIDGKLYRGSTGMAGEIGHAVVDRQGALCKCGSRGCFEAQAAGPGIAARANEARAVHPEGELQPDGASRLTGLAPLTAEAVLSAARDDPLAQRILAETAGDVGLAIRWLITAFDPEMIVLGGGVAGAGERLLDAVRAELERQADESLVFRELYKPELVQLTALGSDAGILGAAALVP